MKLIGFVQANDGDCVWTNPENPAQRIVCWKMTLMERLSALLFGRVWVSFMQKGETSPMWAGCRRSMFKRVWLESKREANTAETNSPTGSPTNPLIDS